MTSIQADTQPAVPGPVEQTVQRLSVEFGSRYSPATIQAIATVCYGNLRHASEPPGTLNELVERSTRERLLHPPRTAADMSWAGALTFWTGKPINHDTWAAVDLFGAGGR